MVWSVSWSLPWPSIWWALPVSGIITLLRHYERLLYIVIHTHVAHFIHDTCTCVVCITIPFPGRLHSLTVVLCCCVLPTEQNCCLHIGTFPAMIWACGHNSSDEDIGLLWAGNKAHVHVHCVWLTYCYYTRYKGCISKEKIKFVLIELLCWQ